MSRYNAKIKKEATPTDSERSIGWLFSLFYLLLLASIIFGVVYFLINYLWEDFPAYSYVLPFIVFGLLPHATKYTAIALAETRGMSLKKRLGKMIGAIHS